MLASRAVVGDPGHPTPVLEAQVRALVLNPAWAIPESIVAEEILPELRRNPQYLVDHDIVVLDRLDTDPCGLSVDWSGLPARGPLPRLQQRPGPTNPLGRIKFDLPNRFDVYLHDSPATALFVQPVRTRSHGCVRVEQAVELATHLLAGQDLGDRDALESALAMGATQWVPVDRPMPVYLLYWTAFVEEGTLHFRDDVYGRDRRLAIALGDAEPPAAPTGSSKSTRGACARGEPVPRGVPMVAIHIARGSLPLDQLAATSGLSGQAESAEPSGDSAGLDQMTPWARPTLTNAATARSRCAGSWAALTWARMRACPRGTTG